jgi:hypothetical protein
MVVPVRQQDPFGIACRVIILPVAQRPDEGTKARKAKDQRCRDQPDQDIHGYLIRIAFRDTVIEDSDIAMADISGVAKPSKATGTAMTL